MLLVFRMMGAVIQSNNSVTFDNNKQHLMEMQ